MLLATSALGHRLQTHSQMSCTAVPDLRAWLDHDRCSVLSGLSQLGHATQHPDSSNGCRFQAFCYLGMLVHTISSPTLNWAKSAGGKLTLAQKHGGGSSDCSAAYRTYCSNSGACISPGAAVFFSNFHQQQTFPVSAPEHEQSLSTSLCDHNNQEQSWESLQKRWENVLDLSF